MLSLLASTLAASLLSLAAPAPQTTQAPPDLSDPEVAHVAVTANTIDIDLGKLAQTRAQNEDVKAFGAAMVNAHGGVNQQAAALAKKLGVTPKDNAVSQSLEKDAQQAKSHLATLKGAAFDRAYIEREIAYHQAVLDAIDKFLLPTTDNAELKQLLTDVRPAIASHLERARQIQGALKK